MNPNVWNLAHDHRYLSSAPALKPSILQTVRHCGEKLQKLVPLLLWLETFNCSCVETQMKKKEVDEQPPLWQKQILPHLSLFCLKAPHKYDLLLSVWKLKMRISKLEVRESCRSLTLDSHLSWTCERWSWSIWLDHASAHSGFSLYYVVFSIYSELPALRPSLPTCCFVPL